MAASKALWQAFPNLSCFSPRISKQSFGGFVEFQRVTRVKNSKRPSPNFFAALASLWSYFWRRPVAFRRVQLDALIRGRERVGRMVAKAGFIVGIDPG
jgi:hypothetical protein